MKARTTTLTGADGITLAADLWGDPDHPPVVLLHGGGQHRGAWHQTAGALADHGWFAVTVDLRGHGESDWPAASDYGIDQFAGDIDQVLTQLPQRPVVIGASLGGIAALACQGRSAQPRFRALVLVDIVPRMELGGVHRVIEFMRAHPDGFATLDDAADVIAAYLPNRARPSNTSGLARTLRQTADGRWHWRWDPQFLMQRPELDGSDPEAFARIVEQLHDVLHDAAARLTMPVLLLRGELSDVVSDRSVDQLLQAVPHAEVITVPGAGHMVAGDRNDAFTSAVVQFLARQDDQCA
jgi:pimeloyl-ACP methyl ester carboxylesterase